jgi:histidine triad (HIT) family protein
VLLRGLRGRWAGRVVGWVFQHMSFAIPVRRLRETASLMAFYHPNPAYPVHVLIVPKQACASLMELSAQDAGFLADLVAAVQWLVRDLGLENKGYRLVVNGGEYQDVAQLHFHLISEG